MMNEQTENEKKLSELFRKWDEEHKEFEGTLKGAGYDVYSSSEEALEAISKHLEADKKAKASSESADSEDASIDE